MADSCILYEFRFIYCILSSLFLGIGFRTQMFRYCCHFSIRRDNLCCIFFREFLQYLAEQTFADS